MLLKTILPILIMLFIGYSISRCYGQVADIAKYSSTRSGQAVFADHVSPVNDPIHWNSQDGAGSQGIDGSSPDFPFGVTPSSINTGPVIVIFEDGFEGDPAVDVAVVINEIMQNPAAVSDSNGEWFELYNPGTVGVNINGWTIQDAGADFHVIDNGGVLIVPAGGYLVLARNATFANNGGVIADYEYSGIILGNGADELILSDGTGEIDRVDWDGGPSFPDPDGASMSLIDPALDNEIGTNWCIATTVFGSGDSGTPGSVNDCP